MFFTDTVCGGRFRSHTKGEEGPEAMDKLNHLKSVIMDYARSRPNGFTRNEVEREVGQFEDQVRLNLKERTHAGSLIDTGHILNSEELTGLTLLVYDDLDEHFSWANQMTVAYMVQHILDGIRKGG